MVFFKMAMLLFIPGSPFFSVGFSVSPFDTSLAGDEKHGMAIGKLSLLWKDIAWEALVEGEGSDSRERQMSKLRQSEGLERREEKASERRKAPLSVQGLRFSIFCLATRSSFPFLFSLSHGLE